MGKIKDIFFGELVGRYKKNTLYTNCNEITKKEKDGNISNHLLPVLGQEKLSAINANMVTDFLVGLTSKEKLSGSGDSNTLSTTTQYNLWLLLRQILDVGVELGYLKENPCDDVPKESIPKANHKEPITFSAEGLSAFLNDVLMQKYLASKAKNALITWMIISTGKSCKDIYQMKWQDVDFSNDSINGEKANELTMALLEAHKFFQDNWLKGHPNVSNPEDLVFIAGRKTDVMHAPSPGSYYQWLKKNAVKWGYTPVNVRSLQKMSAENNIYFKKDAKLLYLVLNKELMEYTVNSVYSDE